MFKAWKTKHVEFFKRDPSHEDLDWLDEVLGPSVEYAAWGVDPLPGGGFGLCGYCLLKKKVSDEEMKPIRGFTFRRMKGDSFKYIVRNAHWKKKVGVNPHKDIKKYCFLEMENPYRKKPPKTVTLAEAARKIGLHQALDFNLAFTHRAVLQEYKFSWQGEYHKWEPVERKARELFKLRKSRTTIKNGKHEATVNDYTNYTGSLVPVDIKSAGAVYGKFKSPNLRIHVTHGQLSYIAERSGIFYVFKQWKPKGKNNCSFFKIDAKTLRRVGIDRQFTRGFGFLDIID